MYNFRVFPSDPRYCMRSRNTAMCTSSSRHKMPNKVAFGNISVPALFMLASFLFLNASIVIGISFRSSNMRVARMDSSHRFKITDNSSRLGMLSMLINDPRKKLSLVQSCSQGIFRRATSIRGGTINCDDGNSQNDDCPDVCCDMPDQNQFDDASKPPKFALLFMDKFCNYHGGYLASKARDVYGVATIDVISSYVAGYMLRAFDADIDGNGQDEQSSISSMRLPSPDQLSQWKQKLPRGIQIVAAICESDSGLGEAELLGEAIPVRYHNGYNEARRDKFLMNEVAAKRGLRTVQQKLCASLDEANAFATELGVGQSPLSLDDTSEEDSKAGIALSRSSTEDIRAEHFNTGRLGGTTSSHHPVPEKDKSRKYCIIKPTRGVASDDVHFCSNLEEVKAAFEKIQGTSIFGSTSGERHDSVLVQEFAVGTEYAIDIISKNGEHKIATLWRYDKRQANGAPFVYFATEVVDAESKIGKIVCEYAMKALDALDIRYGLTHSEFIVNENDEMGRSLGPRLVEVNCRQHNTNFAPLTMAAIGYNALDMLLASLLGDLPGLPEDTEHMRLPWDELPQLPQTRAFAAVVHLVCYEEGLLVAIRHDVLEEIGSLPSVYAMEIYDHFEVGGHIEKTIDIRSDSGWVHIINDDEEQFQHDYDRIVELMPLMFEVVRS